WPQPAQAFRSHGDAERLQAPHKRSQPATHEARKRSPAVDCGRAVEQANRSAPGHYPRDRQVTCEEHLLQARGSNARSGRVSCRGARDDLTPYLKVHLRRPAAQSPPSGRRFSRQLSKLFTEVRLIVKTTSEGNFAQWL